MLTSAAYSGRREEFTNSVMLNCNVVLQPRMTLVIKHHGKVCSRLPLPEFIHNGSVSCPRAVEKFTAYYRQTLDPVRTGRRTQPEHLSAAQLNILGVSQFLPVSGPRSATAGISVT